MINCDFEHHINSIYIVLENGAPAKTVLIKLTNMYKSAIAPMTFFVSILITSLSHHDAMKIWL